MKKYVVEKIGSDVGDMFEIMEGIEESILQIKNSGVLITDKDAQKRMEEIHTLLKFLALKTSELTKDFIKVIQDEV